MPAISSRRIVKTSFWVDISDFAINLGLAFISNSSVMLAEAMQGGADLLTSSLLLWGLRRSSRKPDPEHRFGYGREIYFWTLMAGLVMLVVTATTSFYHGWIHFFNPQIIQFAPLSVGILTIALFTNGYALSLSFRRLNAAVRDESFVELFLESMLIEVKAVFVLDLMGVASAVIGFISLLLYFLTGNSRFDGLGAMVIGVSIAVLAILLIYDVKDLLIGRGASPELEQEIRQAAEGVRGVQKVRQVRTMYVGSEQLLVSMDVNFGDQKTSEEVDHLISCIKKEVHDHVPSAQDIQIELETT